MTQRRKRVYEPADVAAPAKFVAFHGSIESMLSRAIILAQLCSSLEIRLEKKATNIRRNSGSAVSMAQVLLTEDDPEHPPAIPEISRRKLTQAALLAVDEEPQIFC
jgi:hypothetical protein